MQDLILQALNSSEKALQNFIANPDNCEQIEKAGRLLVECFQRGGKIYSCGNGGSMCDAMHFAEELSGRFRENRSPLPAIAIADPSHITCVGNDFGFDFIFSRYIEAHGQKGDVLLAISTSGRSVNILKAAEMALHKEMQIITLTGRVDSQLSQQADVDICAPSTSGYSDRVQEIHIKCIHILIEICEQMLFAQ